jgi:hypothetical protein
MTTTVVFTTNLVQRIQALHTHLTLKGDEHRYL